MSAVIVFNITFICKNFLAPQENYPIQFQIITRLIFFVYHPKWFNIIECYTMLHSSVNEVLHTLQITETYVDCIRKAIPQKNLLLFGHCQNCHDHPPGFLDTYEELCQKKVHFKKKVPQTIWTPVRPPPLLIMAKLKQIFVVGQLPLEGGVIAFGVNRRLCQVALGGSRGSSFYCLCSAVN